MSKTLLNIKQVQDESPLGLYASWPTADAKLNFYDASFTTGNGSSKVISPVKKQTFSSISGAFINFQTQAVSNAAHFDITFPASTVGQFRRAGFTLISSGKIKVLFSAEFASEGSLPDAGTLTLSSGLPLGYINLVCTNASGQFKTAGSATNIIENSKVFRFAAGGGGGSSASGSAGGGELADLMFSAMVRDSFSDSLDGTTPTDVSVGKTDSSLLDVANELIRLSYDASKTVTGTGTAMTLSGAPSFTIKAGDLIVMPSTGEVKRISAISSQTVVTIESAFLADPTAVAVCVSQAVHTVDLNNFTNGGLGLSAASQFSGSIDEIMVGYQDSDTLSDVIPDFGSAADVAFSASTDASAWTTARARVDSLSSQELAVTCPTSNPNLYLRFFANKTSGTGGVNLLSYKVAFQKIFGQTVGGTYFTAFARPTSGIAQNCTHSVVGGKSRFTFTFSYTRGLNSGEASGSILEAIGNGQIIPRFTSGVTDSSQASFIEIDDRTIELDKDYSLDGFDFQFKVQRVGIIDTNTNNVTKIALHDDLLDQSLDAQIVPTFRTAINGAPNGTSFRSDITNRASIPDLSNMLSVQMGPQRMMTQDITQIQGEFGPLGQPVFGVVNDKFNQVRFVGAWTSSNTNDGQRVNASVVGDYVEVVFYGTGLNFVTEIISGAGDLRVSVDGGSEGGNIYVNGSNVLIQRNYSTNQLINVASGLSLGLHTVKIRYAVITAFPVYGFEVLTETSSLRVTSGTVMKGKYKNSLSALQTVAFDSAFESGTLGTKGGCVLVYLKADGTIGKAVTPTDVSAGYLTGASHVNEEVIRTYGHREFGAGRADDFSYHSAAGLTNLAFTLDDGTTTLSGYQVADNNSVDLAVFPNAIGAFVTFTFIGTGLDVALGAGAGSAPFPDNIQVWIDGINQGTMPTSANANVVIKICSGLPYGTHTVRFLRTATVTGVITFKQFIVYAPKKPTLPVGSIEIAQYYKMADYVYSSAPYDSVSSGVISKTFLREVVPVNTWIQAGSGPNPQVVVNGLGLQTSTSGAYVEYTFWGTGFNFRSYKDTNLTATSSMTLNNLLVSTANYTISYNGGAASGTGPSIAVRDNAIVFTPASGNVNHNGTGGAGSNGIIALTGLPLGLHKIRFTNGAANIYPCYQIDIITPIHAPTINGPYVLQNTLTLGNNNFLDLRKFNKKDLPQSNVPKVSFATGIADSPTTASTVNIPIPDMSVVYRSEGEMVKVDYIGAHSTSLQGNAAFFQIYHNGVALGPRAYQLSFSPFYPAFVSANRTIFLPKGEHKFDVYFAGGNGTNQCLGVFRQLTVTKLGNQ